MKRFIKSLVLVTFWAGMAIPAWGQAAPTTEGRDFWVTFLRAADDDPTELKLTISAREACKVVIENTNTGFKQEEEVTDNSSTELVMDRNNSYSSSNETATYTALHVTATKDISLFAGNYRNKSFDATNVLPTSALLDDYIIQTYPPSDHENKPQGSHFAIIAVEDGETTVDYNLTAQTNGSKTGAQSVTLTKGQVWYVWTGKNSGDAADLSGTTVKARNGKKIAVFQGCPHTNIPNKVRDRDHIVSQAMPTAYWGTEFGITASRQHRRDIVAIMAINDGTEVYINTPDGEPQLVHTFDFNADKKHYWTFELGEEVAYCTDNDQKKKLDAPLVVDSSCYITTSCPAGVHLFMVSNRYDNVSESGTNDCDPAMLWISPIEQVIKEINFSTYTTQQAKYHYMNILTTTSNAASMTWNNQNISKYFHPLRGNEDYSYARIEIQAGNHNLKGKLGFLAHVYGYGERESYAYSCGSSTVQRSISFNDEPLLLDSVSTSTFYINQVIEMKLNIGNNDYQRVIWDFGDGVTYIPAPDASNKDKKIARHTYTSPGWYDLQVTAEYINSCTGQKHTETMSTSFRVIRPEEVDLGLKFDRSLEVCYGEDFIIHFVLDTNSIEDRLSDTVVLECEAVKLSEKLELEKDKSGASGTVTLPFDSVFDPGIYDCIISAEDLYTGSTRAYKVPVSVSYPSSILKPKFGNTIAIYSKGYGGNQNPGWEIAEGTHTFQWYHDGEAIPDATGPVYYCKDETGKPVNLNGEYAVEITSTATKQAIMTCSIELTDGVIDNNSAAVPAFVEDEKQPSGSTDANSTQAQKVIQNRQILIYRDGHYYTIYGQMVNH